MAEKISLLISVIAALLQPQPAEKCQGTECKQPNWQELKLTIINGVPSLLCSTCISEIDNQSNKLRDEYQKTPSNLLKGILFGTVGAVIGAISWALVFVFLNRIGAAFAILTVFLVYKAMDKAGAKPGLLSSVSAGVIALGAGLLGTYLGILGYFIKELDAILSFPLLARVAQGLIDEPELLRETLLFSLLGIVPYVFFSWLNQRELFKRIFAPEVEVIENYRH